ncbi:MAG: ABC transporter [Rhodospirillaceae bacterium]|nr:ABC transporter [Rhodospirillaceae bacterium]|tara:strand:- start:153 stop:2078 length:1926 start_codon:yes stop_codon:yes gene_type:complete
MIEKIKNTDRSVLAVMCVGLAIIFFLAFNALINTAFTSSRLDLTQDKLFTLSDGTKKLLSTIDEPIDVRLYYSRRFNEIGPDIARHATRVTELLGEYERLSNGMIRFEVFDPEPFSPEEDLAVSDGLQGLPFDQSGELVYFGVAGTNSTDDTDSIGYLSPERGPFLEYDLTRLVHNLANPDKARITILSDLPLQGTKFDNYKEWLIVEGMKQFFDVQFIDREDKKIPEKTEVLVIAAVHTLNPSLTYAIDQFVMKGGRILAFVDPFAESMALAGPQAGQLPPPGVGIGAMTPLLKSWGVEMPAGKFVANSDDAVRVGFPDPESGQQVAVDYVSWLTLVGDRFSKNDTVSGQLQRIVVSSAGAFLPTKESSIKFEPLIYTSKNSNLMDAFEIAQQPNPITLMKKFQSEDKSYPIAVRISGNIKSLYPDGPPKEVTKLDKDTTSVDVSHLSETKVPLNAILVGDADFLADRNWARVQEIAGQRLTMPQANNADFAINALDNLRGSQALVGLRGRGLSVRPFEIIKEMRQIADDKFRAREQELLNSISKIEKNIDELKREEQNTGVILTSAQQNEIDNFRVKMLDSRRDLRQVQRSLRNDVETLENRIRVVNIWAVPVVIAFIAILLAFVRRARRARFYRTALH